MSHYAVAVITDNKTSVDTLLAPYDENIDVAPYICKTKNQIIEEGRKCIINLRKDMKDYADNPDEYLKNYRAYWLESEFVNPPKLSQPAKDTIACEKMTDEEIYQKCIYEDTDYDSEGNELSTYNPNSKWDWYEIGGRWSNGIKKTDGSNCDSCYVADMLIGRNEDTYKKAIRFWEVVVEEKPLKDGEDISNFKSWYKKEYYMERYLSKEIYADSVSKENNFYAIVTPDGVWHEPGRMGWFGTSLAEYEDERKWDTNYFKDYIEPYLDHDHTITIVDCHI